MNCVTSLPGPPSQKPMARMVSSAKVHDAPAVGCGRPYVGEDWGSPKTVTPAGTLPDRGCRTPHMVIAVVLLVGGLMLLTLAADRFVVSAAGLSKAWGLSPILVGALVIGLGTSAPEFLVSILASGRGETDLAMGNIVGSNAANVTLVLGTTALIAPIRSQLRTLRREGVVMFIAVAAFAILLWDLELGRIEGGGLALGMVVTVLLMVRWARGDARAGRLPLAVEGSASFNARKEILVGAGMLGLTIVGAELLVRGAGRLAVELEISSAFVGLVIVAVGTSLPELATAVAAARRGETDLVLGNVLGSNLFNSLMVGGSAAIIRPGIVDPDFRIPLGFMVASALIAGLFVVTGRSLVRWEGASLLAVFVGFVAVAG